MAVAIRPTPIEIPFLGIRFELSALDKKILSVAIASLVFFGLQMRLSFPITLVATLVITALTYLSEKYIRTEPPQQNDWFNTNIDKKELAFFAALVLLKPLILQIVFWALGIPLSLPAQEGVVTLLLANPWRMIPIATIIAPVAEEILFRGFLLERLEDATQLLNRHTFCILSQKAGQEISNVAQALIFGAIHLKSAIKDGLEIHIFLILSYMGYLFGKMKQEKLSLIPPMVLHAANNTGFVAHLFATRPVAP
jgi:membrane protease YdiL (CAAX protease family)